MGNKRYYQTLEGGERLSDNEHEILQTLPIPTNSIRKHTREALVKKGLVIEFNEQLVPTERGKELASRPNLTAPAFDVLERLKIAPIPFREWKKIHPNITRVLVRKEYVQDDGFGCVILTDKAKKEAA